METTTYTTEIATWNQVPSSERLSSFVTSRLALLDDVELDLN